ncbi:MAG: BON domain-containing protein [Firmicutes bacterium]|nr:BON domain-containing protein [Bacillota bacterium]
MGVLDDREIAARVKRALLNHTQSSGLDVHVECQDGVVQLSGAVDVLADRQQAEYIAGRVSGVRGVSNGLTVAMDGNVSDEHLRQEVGKKLGTSDLARGVGAEVRGGRVTLLGRVDNLAQAREAFRLASGTRGVREVCSDIRLDAGAPNDVAVVNAVEQALTEAGLDAAHIDTMAEDNQVTLRGWVDHAGQKSRAEQVVSELDGVRAVENELGLRQPEEVEG